MSDDGSVSRWIDGVKRGDDDAARRLWERYFDQLVRLCGKHLGRHARQAADEEDVVLSAMDSFCRRAHEGRFPQLTDRDSLWKLLVVMSARKARHYRQFEEAQKRDARRRDDAADADGRQLVLHLAAADPSPDFAVLVAEQFDRLLNSLGDESLRTVARRKIECYTNQEIADELEISLRSVERKLWVIRKCWKDAEESNHE